MTSLKKGLLTVAFAGATLGLGGCATMNHTSTNDCVERNGVSLNIPLIASYSNRSDKFSEACAAARAATTISQMRKKDGSPDMGMYNLAVSMYEQSNAKVREFMDKMLKEEGTTIENLRFEIAREKEPVVCERVESTAADGTAQTGFRCVNRQQPQAAAAR
ncbi:MAG: hypothetical protein Q8K65_01530 [Alphaproteobacteria bacterium]|nr:hypothetical protein [Alphaproteobacteria bacterium]